MSRAYPGDRQQRLAIAIHSRPYATAAVVRALMEEGYSVIEQPLNVDAVRLIGELSPDIVILAMDPDVDPWPLDDDLEEFLRRQPTIAIVPDTAQRLGRLLDAFAVICIRDADAGESLAPQLRALQRFQAKEPEEPVSNLASASGIEVDFAGLRATYRGVPLDLGPSATSILGYLLRESGRIVPPAELLQATLRRAYAEAEARLVARQYIRRIRRALEAAGGESNLVVNVRGFGYMVDPNGGNGASRRGIDSPGNPRMLRSRYPSDA